MKKVFSYESLTCRRLFGAFEVLGKKQRIVKTYTDHRDRMRFANRIKKMGQQYDVDFLEERPLEFVTSPKYVILF